jgi:hypothetical protein
MSSLNPYSEETLGRSLGRNEPCPCGSGKKYKRCHGVDAAPKLSQPATPPVTSENIQQAASAAGMPGFDPSKLDPAMIAQMGQVMRQIPKGQLMRLQSIMQKAMAGKDVKEEAAEFERALPPHLQESLRAMGMAAMGGMGMPAAGGDVAPENLSVDDAKAIVEKAMKEGKISSDQAEDLLKVEGTATPEKASLWKRLTGKK